MEIKVWDILEDIIEELYLNKIHAKKQEKRKVGRPKKQNYVQINQPSIDTFLRREKQEGEENNINYNNNGAEEEMALDN